jgi:ketosteroid isomerase-like protein
VSRNRQVFDAKGHAGITFDGYHGKLVINTGMDGMDQETSRLREIADAFIAASNARDVADVLALFAPDAVIDDPSTGHRFEGRAGIRDYVERYFVGYHTVTRFLSMENLGQHRARVRVDFTGDFGHEIGLLVMSFNVCGAIIRIDADLE